MARVRTASVATCLALCLAVPVGVTAPSAGTTDVVAGPAGELAGAPATQWDRALSTPQEDSYYPDKGDPTVDALRYHLALDWRRRARVLTGRATIVLRTTRADAVMRLDLSHRMRVRTVWVDRRRVPFARAGNHLLVQRPVGADERHRVEVAYGGTPRPARGPASRPDIARTGMRVTRDGRLWTMQEPFGGFTWFPVNDHPSDKAFYSLRVTTPSDFVAVSNGALRSRRTTQGRTTVRWVNRDPMPSYLLTLAVGPYRSYRQSGPHGIPVRHWVPRDRPELVQPLLRTPEALRWLERRLGPYPFDRAGVVVTPGGSAMETQTLVTFGAQTYGYGRFEVRAILVHELAHQWWGDAVTPSDWVDLWMNEGMATYLESRWRDDHSDAGSQDWDRTVRLWARVDQDLRDSYGPPGSYDRGEFASVNVYWSTALMWERLHRRLGDQTFSRLVRRWPQTHLYRSSGRDELVAWWSARAGEDLGPFFDRWLDSPQSPA
ncbi:MAG TPA: M1 family metallopeptidase [Nocardioidaceae bacterium]|nr:M1 family metallopeptidase [Nocardioidaceae bacterium]